MKWDVYNAADKWLGTIHGATSEEALENAKQFMPDAVRVSERDMPIYRGQWKDS